VEIKAFNNAFNEEVVHIILIYFRFKKNFTIVENGGITDKDEINQRRVY